jgi:membrane protein YdbS with pleckstrin-like domain
MPDVFVSPKKGIQNSVATEETTAPILPERQPKTEVEKSAIPGHSHNPLSAFYFYPDHIDFESRTKEEKVVLLLRQHMIVNVKWVLATIVIFFVPSVARMFGVFSSLPSGFELIITMAWYLVTMAYAFENFLSWYFNVYIVTDMRVIDVDFYNLIYKEVSDANLNKIQDITYNMGGVSRAVFNYGDVFIQTAAEVSEFDFLAVPNPDKVTKIIEDLVTKTSKNGRNT